MNLIPAYDSFRFRIKIHNVLPVFGIRRVSIFRIESNNHSVLLIQT
ncbi:hypothetical protein LEP1GSC161_1980 [Leptospira santarosai str. CBC1416]|uniref:Uncharacterized protein n=2 Tax=Leptospira santarosai TaxID=28183 RepID=A0A0E2BCF8_9LEPT|nr:hypothetical protein LEP1GSC179_3782 [Leptospira santarosai str. MOR084]EKR91181.1 hypothetical protein LEP1GSC163_3454 [Leptospira santarosai str. CBC379]EKS07090.1 hypothetical protein LEP1GSC071_1910 [Leptospira santarosai str. JET]EMF91886.1 hypothetical protein LEP1GSC005_3764 [Leptospira santarosai str. ST188]EMJ47839.1 hypothetical protein LEP1GSC169_2951 [Leptospira santarosai str. HAI1349]EMM85750.1 hypothetical protein LEP1GSC039_1572 [Leptospira santarosai str. 2000027870]EMO344